MKIVLTGSGTGGHFYPLIAIAEAIHDVVRERRLIEPKLYHIAPKPFDEEALFENQIAFIACPAGKVRRYFSLQNVTDLFMAGIGYLTALFILLRIFPDVVVSKGGYTSVPVVFAAHTLGIPVLIHESDVKPGRANLIAAPFAKRIAITFDESAQYFPPRARVLMARTGVPIRKAVAHPEIEGAKQYLQLDSSVPTILVLGGSSGALRVNEVILEALPDFVAFANIIHQTGKDHFAETEKTAKFILDKHPNASRYHPYPYLNALSLRRAAGACDFVISRAGATTIAEIALWRKPALLIPIPESISHDQRTNAYAYAHAGAGLVLEENNVTRHVLVSEVKRVLSDPTLVQTMIERSAAFGGESAARLIAEEVIAMALSHEPPNKEISAPTV